mgnify:FL=1
MYFFKIFRKKNQRMFICKHVVFYSCVLCQILEEGTTAGFCCMCCHIHVRVEPGTQIFRRVCGDYINVASPYATDRHRFDSCLLVPITRNSILLLFKINMSFIIHKRTSAVQLCTAFRALLRSIFHIGS